MLKEILNKKQENHKPSGKFSISSIGSCLRTKYLELKGEHKKEYSEQLLRLFDIGNIIHRGIFKELIEKGHGKGIEVVGAEVNIRQNKYFSGRVDIIISDGEKNYIVDVKSASKFTMAAVRKGNCEENYKNQVLLYMYFTGIHNSILLFVSKVDGEIEEVEVKYDERKAKELITEIESFFKNYVNKNILPPKCTKKISPFGCDVCYPKEGKLK